MLFLLSIVVLHIHSGREDMELTLDCNDERPVKEDGPDGYSAMTIFSSPAGCQGLTYDDIILMPGERCDTCSMRLIFVMVVACVTCSTLVRISVCISYLSTTIRENWESPYLAV